MSFLASMIWFGGCMENAFWPCGKYFWVLSKYFLAICITNNCWLHGKYLSALWQIWRISEQQAAPNVRPCVSGGVQIPAPHSHVCPAVLSSFVTPYTLHAFAHTEYFPRLYSVILVRVIRTLACSSLFGAKSAICRRVTSHARESQYVRCSDERHKSTSLDIDLEYSKYSRSSVLGITVGATCAGRGNNAHNTCWSCARWSWCEPKVPATTFPWH